MSFADREGSIWMDGEMVDWRDATDAPADHTRCTMA